MASIVALRMIKALVRLGWSVDRASGTSHHVLTKAGRHLANREQRWHRSPVW